MAQGTLRGGRKRGPNGSVRAAQETEHQFGTEVRKERCLCVGRDFG